MQSMENYKREESKGRTSMVVLTEHQEIYCMLITKYMYSSVYISLNFSYKGDDQINILSPCLCQVIAHHLTVPLK